MEDEAMSIKIGIEKALSVFFEELSEEGVDVDSVDVQIEYNDGFHFIEFKDYDPVGWLN